MLCSIYHYYYHYLSILHSLLTVGVLIPASLASSQLTALRCVGLHVCDPVQLTSLFGLGRFCACKNSWRVYRTTAPHLPRPQPQPARSARATTTMTKGIPMPIGHSHSEMAVYLAVAFRIYLISEFDPTYCETQHDE